MFERRTGAVLADQLVDWGVDHIYGIPGDSVNEFISDLHRKEEELKFIQVRHEEAGALAAAAYAKLTGKLGVCLSIAGPGAVHLMNGLYDAREDNAPVLAIVGQVKSHELGTGAFQEVKLEQMFEDVAVFNERAASFEQLPDLMNQAIREAYANSGVSVLVVPDDLFAQKHPEKPGKTSANYAKPRITPSKQDLQEAIKLINNAKKPVILAGRGTKHARAELITFAEHIKSPIILSLLAKGVIPDMHSYNLGQNGQIGTTPSYEAVMEADLLLLAGTSFPYRAFLPDDVPAIQIDIEPSKLGSIYPIQVGLPGDTKEVLAELTATTEAKQETAFIEKYQGKMREWHTQLQKQKKREDSPIQPPQIMYALEKNMDKDAVISSDVGNVTVWTTRYLPLTHQEFVVSGRLATMGCGLPGAIAAKMAYPDKQAIAICGDGGFSMNMQDFVTAVKYDLPVKVIVLNNSQLGLIKFEQATIGSSNYGIDMGEMNFAKFGESCGGEGYRVEKFEDLETSMKQAFLSDKPAVIDVVIEDLAPLPGKISYQQAVKYTEYLIKEFFSTGKIELPNMKESVKRLLK
ncbi:pyruvate oxidase [Terribacillus aidingensis]|uniref:Pyruvate oxidase n=1 Tax=Terribacillus aidingensis TaxID=586416 RepID=A0A285NIZ0_9BACI|nr:pyruvate oxidase [Terribacillus aidingensis]SNZ09228.1 pyruvate oxidase [Terribacillus aidingensis]